MINPESVASYATAELRDWARAFEKETPPLSMELRDAAALIEALEGRIRDLEYDLRFERGLSEAIRPKDQD